MEEKKEDESVNIFVGCANIGQTFPLGVGATAVNLCRLQIVKKTLWYRIPQCHHDIDNLNRNLELNPFFHWKLERRACSCMYSGICRWFSWLATAQVAQLRSLNVFGTW